jgi:alpha,alpha-trehalase
LHLIATLALERAGYHREAERIARKWIQTNLAWFEAHGEFLEKYNVVELGREPLEGVYPSQSGFAWTNAVFINLCRRYLREDELPDIEDIPEQSVLKQLVRNPRKTIRRGSGRINYEVVRKLQ